MSLSPNLDPVRKDVLYVPPVFGPLPAKPRTPLKAKIVGRQPDGTAVVELLAGARDGEWMRNVSHDPAGASLNSWHYAGEPEKHRGTAQPGT